MEKIADIAWLAGIIDGEGCFSVKRPIRRGDGGPGFTTYQVWMVICNTNEPMMRRAAKILRDLGIQHQPIRKVWKGSRATRYQYWLHVARKDELRRLVDCLLPHLTAKLDEAKIVAWYLSRACKVRSYRQTQLDRLMLDQLAIIKRNGGEAPVEVLQTINEVIPSQAVEGFSSTEGVETRPVSPNDNPVQECPALKPKLEVVI